MKNYEITYVVGNTYRRKYIVAENAGQAIKRARVKNIVDIDIVEYRQHDDYIWRDF